MTDLLLKALSKYLVWKCSALFTVQFRLSETHFSQLHVCVLRIALVFQVIVQNRYKLYKKCRRLTEEAARDPDNEHLRHMLAETKVRCH